MAKKAIIQVNSLIDNCHINAQETFGVNITKAIRLALEEVNEVNKIELNVDALINNIIIDVAPPHLSITSIVQAKEHLSRLVTEFNETIKFVQKAGLNVSVKQDKDTPIIISIKK